MSNSTPTANVMDPNGGNGQGYAQHLQQMGQQAQASQASQIMPPADYGMANLAMNNQQGVYGQQQGNNAALQVSAWGGGPSAAAGQLQQGMEASQRAAMAAQSGARGVSAGANRAGMQAQGVGGMGAAMGAASTRAGEQQQAQGAYMGSLGGTQQGQLQAAATGTQMGLGQANLTLQQRQNTNQYQQGLENLGLGYTNAGLGYQESEANIAAKQQMSQNAILAQQTAQGISGFSSGIGAGMSMASDERLKKRVSDLSSRILKASRGH